MLETVINGVKKVGENVYKFFLQVYKNFLGARKGMNV